MLVVSNLVNASCLRMSFAVVVRSDLIFLVTSKFMLIVVHITGLLK